MVTGETTQKDLPVTDHAHHGELKHRLGLSRKVLNQISILILDELKQETWKQLKSFISTSLSPK